RQESANVKSLRQEVETLVAGKLPVPQFRALVEDPHIDDKINDAEQRLAALARSVEIKRQPLPEQYRIPTLNLREVFDVLNSTLESVHAQAAAKVTDHLSHLNEDRKSTRLNSSHVSISYAVFCLKKKMKVPHIEHSI